MKKILELKDAIISVALPTGSKRRMIIQYIYRMLRNKENREYLLKNGFKKSFYKLVVPDSREYQEQRYNQWLKNNTLTQEQLNEQKNKKFSNEPLISIITPLYNTPKQYFIEYIESIKNQTYANWEICLVDASDKDLDYISEIIGNNTKIKYKKLEKNKGISENSNEALKLATGEFIALVDHDDVIAPNALYEIVKEINRNPKLDVIYSDEDKFEGNLENRFYPFFKPNFSPDFLRSNNYICHLSCIRANIINKIGGFRKEFDGAQDYDLFLRLSEKTNNILHIPKVLYHWRVHNLSTAQNMDSKMFAIEAGRKAI